MLKKLKSTVCIALDLAICLPFFPIADNVTQFNDVPSNHWAYEAINFVISKGYMGETDNGRFEPDITASRGMIITTLYRLAGEPAVNTSTKPFPDVELGIWAYNGNSILQISDKLN